MKNMLDELRSRQTSSGDGTGSKKKPRMSLGCGEDSMDSSMPLMMEAMATPTGSNSLHEALSNDRFARLEEEHESKYGEVSFEEKHSNYFVSCATVGFRS